MDTETDMGLMLGLITGGIVLVLLIIVAGFGLTHNAEIAAQRKQCLQSGQTWDDMGSFCYGKGETE